MAMAIEQHEMVILLLLLSALVLLWNGIRHRSSTLARFPVFLPGASFSDLPYALLDVLSSKGPTPYLLEKHAQLGNVIRTGPRRLHLSTVSPRLLRALGRCEKAPSYAGFDIDGHASLFSERSRERHRRRGKLAPQFIVSDVQRTAIVEKNAKRVCTNIRAKIDASGNQCGEVDVNLLGIFRAFAIDTASEILFPETGSYGAIEELEKRNRTIPKEKSSEETDSRLERPSIGIVNDHFNAAVPLALCNNNALARACSSLQSLLSTMIYRQPSDDVCSGPEVGVSLAKFDRYVDAVLNGTETSAAEDNKEHSDDNKAVQGRSTISYASTLSRSRLYRPLARTELRAALYAEVCDVLFAATESLATTLALGLRCINEHEEIVARLLESNVGEGEQEDESISDAALSKKSYLVSIVNECLRVASPVPRALDRIVGPHDEIVLDDGTPIPCGTVIGVSPECFHQQQGDTFDPDRWLKEEDDDEEDRQNGASHIAFGLPGSRACIAKNLAMTELCVMVSAFCRQFVIVDAKVSKSEPRDFWNKGFKNGMLSAKVRLRGKP